MPAPEHIRDVIREVEAAGLTKQAAVLREYTNADLSPVLVEVALSIRDLDNHVRPAIEAYDRLARTEEIKAAAAQTAANTAAKEQAEREERQDRAAERVAKTLREAKSNPIVTGIGSAVSMGILAIMYQQCNIPPPAQHSPPSIVAPSSSPGEPNGDRSDP